MEFLKLEQGNMSVGDYAAKFEELTRFCPYSELEVDGRSKCSKFESGLRPKLKSMFGYQEIVDFPTLVNKYRVYEDDLAADEAAAPKVIPFKNYGPQHNHMQEKGKEKVGEDQRPYPSPNDHRNRDSQGSKPIDGEFPHDSFTLCRKCGRKHVGPICPGSRNGCFHCKQRGHMKRFCPKLNRGVNVVRADRPRTTGWAFTTRGTETSDVDDPNQVSALGVSLERENCRLGERGSPGRVKSWAILKDSRLSERGLA
ncbi:hypothetical protein Lal_00033356 [Lupinus albus]|nr:hypothetical protein Lal_00033356 [Lupinus albus]